MRGNHSNTILEVAVATCGPEGAGRVAAMGLPRLQGVGYLVSWQLSDTDIASAVVPDSLASRDDVRVVILRGLGLSRNRNNCLREACGELMMFADDDLRLNPEGLAEVIETFRRIPSLDYGSFRFDSDVPKQYPPSAPDGTPLHRLPRGFYQSSVEVVLRLRNPDGTPAPASALRFNEDFGLGAPRYTAGEEELLLRRARNASMDCRAFDITTAFHPGASTGMSLSPGSLMARGVCAAVEYPLTAPLRIMLTAYRLSRQQGGRFLPFLGSMARGCIEGYTSRKLRRYLGGKISQPDNRPLLTIVIPVYNRAGMVEDTLRSIEAQTLRPLRVVLVDNGSTDGSMEVLARWKQRAATPDFQITLLEESRPGACAARNRGLREVDTPYVMFFDSDDTMAPGHCARAVEALQANPGVEVAGWDVLCRKAGGNAFKARFSTRNALWNNIQHGSMATQRYCLTTALARKAGGWDTACAAWNDMEFGVRLLLLSPRMIKLGGKPTVFVNVHPQSITGTSFARRSDLLENTLDTIEDTLAKAGRTDAVRWVNLRRAILAGLYTREGATDKARRLMSATLAKEPSRRRRSALRGAMTITARGMRGAARIFRLLI